MQAYSELLAKLDETIEELLSTVPRPTPLPWRNPERELMPFADDLTIPNFRKFKGDSTTCFLTILTHGCVIKKAEMKEPFKTPIEITRYMATDFGTLNYLSKELIRDIKRNAIDGNFGDIKKIIDNRPQIKDEKKLLKGRADFPVEFPLFLASKHHVKPKVFLKNQEMMDKIYEREEKTDEIILTDSYGASVDMMNVFRTNKVKLSDILLYLKGWGYTLCFIYDFSCNGEGDVEDYSRLGGTRRKRISKLGRKTCRSFS